MRHSIYLFALLATIVRGQSSLDYVDECPERFGFYADALQCDRYYECNEGEILDHYCPDGLVFDESSTAFAKCSFPFSVNCTDRPELQKPQPTKLCPRRNGYFPHEDPQVCDKFYFCVDGVANPITCPNTLIFDPSKGQCAFSDQVTRKGCSSEEVFQFTCPNVRNSPHEHPRYPDPNDCQFFYICIGGTNARRNGCTIGLVFNPETLACDRPSNVQGPCRTWYNETFLESVAPPPPRRPDLPGGVRLDEKPGRRVAVRRRKPSGAQGPISNVPTANIAGSPLLSGNNFDSRTNLSPVAQSSNNFAAQRNRQRTRTRVRPRPQAAVPSAVEEASVPQRRPTGPPSFSLSSDEAIQQFRQSNRFVPTGNNGGGRLTVLSSNSQSKRPQVSPAFEEDVSEFTSFPAVPNRRPPPRQSAFESFDQVDEPVLNRQQDQLESAQPQPPLTTRQQILQSRRPPSAPTRQSTTFDEIYDDFGSRRPVQEEPEEPSFHSDRFQTSFGGRPRQQEASSVRSQPAADPPRASVDPAPASTADFSSQRTKFRSRNRASIPVRASSQSRNSEEETETSFAPTRSRNRLQVTPIKVRPQTDLAANDPEAFDVPRVPTARQRGRQRQRQRQRNNF